MSNDAKPLARGMFWEELPAGARFRTAGRTLTETDLVNFVNLSWITEELFTNIHDRDGMAIKGRVVPGALVYCCAEGLIAPLVHGTGLAFLTATIEAKKPTFVGDTIHVECTVTESRKTSKSDHGLVRSENNVVNQNGEIVFSYSALRIIKGRNG